MTLRQPNDGQNTSSCSGEKGVGTDLNRNFDTEWNSTWAVHDPCDDTYHGTKPFSAPETKVEALIVCKLIRYNFIFGRL